MKSNYLLSFPGLDKGEDFIRLRGAGQRTFVTLRTWYLRWLIKLRHDPSKHSLLWCTYKGPMDRQPHHGIGPRSIHPIGSRIFVALIEGTQMNPRKNPSIRQGSTIRLSALSNSQTTENYGNQMNHTHSRIGQTHSSGDMRIWNSPPVVFLLFNFRISQGNGV